jgi:hypothetical protein
MSAYPVAYDQSPPVKRSRLTVFFRYFMLIPHWFFAVFYGIGAWVVLTIAWFAILFTGRYPAGMYNFISGYLHYLARLQAYSSLIVDEYPPFDGAEHPEYPVRVKIGPPQAQYSRVKAFFRYILSIPIFVLQWAFLVWIGAVSIAIWFVAVFTGETSKALTEAVRFPMSYYVRSTAYVYLMTDTYPAVSETETLPHLSQPVT